MFQILSVFGKRVALEHQLPTKNWWPFVPITWDLGLRDEFVCEPSQGVGEAQFWLVQKCPSQLARASDLAVLVCEVENETSAWWMCVFSVGHTPFFFGCV